MHRRWKHIVISLRWAGEARPLAPPMGELARLKAVTERAGMHPLAVRACDPAVDPHRWGSPGSLDSGSRD